MNKIINAVMAAGLLFGAGSLIESRPVFAQASTTVGSLRGVLRDKSAAGEAAVGATIVATSPALQGEQVVITDETGQYFITSLPPGVYTLTVYYNDATFSRGNVLIQIGKEAVVNISVDSKANDGKPKGKGEIIEIQGSAPIVDQGSTKTGITITEDFTRNVPTARTFGGVIGGAAGAQSDYSENGVGISFSGATDLENTYIVEGINTTDTGYGGISANLPNEFIQETEVITGGYNAEYGRATGGIVNVVTKSGGNEVHGSVFGYFRPGAFVSAAKVVQHEGGAIDSRNDLDYTADFGAEVGGPIIKDKLWFHVGFNPSLQSNTITRLVQRQVDANQDGVPDTDANGFTVHEPVSQSTFSSTSKTYFFTAKLSGAVDQNNQFQVSAFGNPQYTAFPGGLTHNPSQDLFTKDEGAFDVSAKWTSKLNKGKTEIDGVLGFHRGFSYDGLGANMPNNPEVYYNYERSLYDFSDLEGGNSTIGKCQDDVPGDPYPKIRNCPVTKYVEQGGGYLERGTKDRTTAVVSLTQRVKAAGYHVFKIGADAELATFDAQKQYTGGVVLRRSADTTTGAPGRWQDRRFMSVVRNLSTSEVAAPDNIALMQDQLLCSADPTTGANRALCHIEQSISANTNDTNYGAFVQDSWQIRPNFTLNAGLRYEDQIGYVGKQLKNQVTPDGEIVGDQAFNLNNLWAPRLGFIYDPTQEGKAKLFGHWGRFYENVPMDLQVRSYGGEYENFDLINNSRHKAGDIGYDPNCDIDHNGAAIDVAKLEMCKDRVNQAQSGGPSEYLSPGLQGQYTDELILGTEYEFAADLKVGLNYIHRSLPNVIEDVSTDGGNNYMITNPGSDFSAEATKLRTQATAEMNNSNPDIQALGKVHAARADQLDYVSHFEKPVRNYDGVQLTATQRPTKRSLLLASYTYSMSRGNYPGLFSTETGQADPNITSLYDLPDLMANRYGPMGLDRPHNLKVDAFYQFDLKKAGVLTTGGSFRAQSGIAHNLLGESSHSGYDEGESYILPRGAVKRSPVTSQLDIHVSYGRRLNKHTMIEGFLNVFNLFNQQEQLNVDESYTFDRVNPIVGGTMSDLDHAKTVDENGIEQNKSPTPNKNFNHSAVGATGLGGPAIQAPRNVQIGFRLTF